MARLARGGVPTTRVPVAQHGAFGVAALRIGLQALKLQAVVCEAVLMRHLIVIAEERPIVREPLATPLLHLPFLNVSHRKL